MVNKDIQMKKNTNGVWDNLHPLTITKNVSDEKRNKKLTDVLDDFDKQILYLSNDVLSRGVNVFYPPIPYVKPIGDGISDDTDVLQSLVNNFDYLLFPKNKTFIVSKPIQLKHYNELNFNGSTLKWKDFTLIGEDNGVINLYGELNNIKIYDLIIDGNLSTNNWVHEKTYSQNSSNGMDGIRGGSCSNLVLKNIILLDIQKMGIVINGTGQNILIENCLVDYANRDGIWAVGRDVLVKNCIVRHSRDNSFASDCAFISDITKVGNIRFEGCSSYSNGDKAYQSGIYIGGKEGSVPKDFTVSNCSFYNPTFSGVNVVYAKDVTIDNVKIYSPRNSDIKGANGIALEYCDNIKLLNIHCDNAETSAVALRYSTKVTIDNLYALENEYTGVFIDAGNNNVKISNGFLQNNGRGANSAGVLIRKGAGTPSNNVKVYDTSFAGFASVDGDKQMYAIYGEDMFLNVGLSNNDVKESPLYVNEKVTNYTTAIEKDNYFSLDWNKSKNYRIIMTDDASNIVGLNPIDGETYTVNIRNATPFSITKWGGNFRLPTVTDSRYTGDNTFVFVYVNGTYNCIFMYKTPIV